jgi:hypothetical protein
MEKKIKGQEEILPELHTEMPEELKTKEKKKKEEKKEKIFVGYHPITGAEVWQ